MSRFQWVDEVNVILDAALDPLLVLVLHVTMVTIRINRILVSRSPPHHHVLPAGNKGWRVRMKLLRLPSAHTVFSCAVHWSVLLSLTRRSSFTISFVCALFPEAIISLGSTHGAAVRSQTFAVHSTLTWRQNLVETICNKPSSNVLQRVNIAPTDAVYISPPAVQGFRTSLVLADFNKTSARCVEFY